MDWVYCGACHTTRNLLRRRARRRGLSGGGGAEGWDAPALTRLSQAPLPGPEDALFAYLRTGASPDHGTAAGPMAPVVRELTALPDSDIRAIGGLSRGSNAPVAQTEIEVRRRKVVSSTAIQLPPGDKR